MNDQDLQHELQGYSDAHQAHGMSHREIRELGLRQQNGMPIEHIPGNNGRADQINDPFFRAYIEKQFPNGYSFPIHERGHVHTISEPRLFDSSTGQKISTIRIDKFSPAMFEFVKNNFGFAAKIAHILHFAEHFASGERINMDFDLTSKPKATRDLSDETGQD